MKSIVIAMAMMATLMIGGVAWADGYRDAYGHWVEVNNNSNNGYNPGIAKSNQDCAPARSYYDENFHTRYPAPNNKTEGDEYERERIQREQERNRNR